MLLTIDKKKIIMAYYEEYKKQYELDIINIVPKAINNTSIMEIAYTDNEELVNCIKKNIPVTFYYSKKLFKSSEKYIKATLYHEFTHIKDCYNFMKVENSAFLMSSYSEYNAKQIEFFLRCNEQQDVGLDCKICDEKGKITPRQEIEQYLRFIIGVSNYEDKMEDMVNSFVKYMFWMFAILSFYESSEPKYFQSCFDRMNYECRIFAKRLYQEVQDIEKIKENPNVLASMVIKLVMVCVLKEEM